MSNKTLTPMIAGFCMAALLSIQPAHGATLNFQLLTWTDANATTELPSAVGRKPSATMPTAGDWLVFTADDALLAAGNNPAGAVSHNLVDITGAGGPGYNLAPSLSGTLSLQLESVSGSNWSATVSALAYSGQANAAQTMNQFLVTPGSPATTNSAFNVDGAGNSGQWAASRAIPAGASQSASAHQRDLSARHADGQVPPRIRGPLTAHHDQFADWQHDHRLQHANTRRRRAANPLAAFHQRTARSPLHRRRGSGL